MAKLSASQIAMLTRMAGGADVRVIHSREGSAYFTAPGMITANKGTLFALNARGLVERVQFRAGLSRYAITAAGREAAPQDGPEPSGGGAPHKDSERA